MPIDIDRLTEAELVDLNHRIVARLKFLAQMRAHASMLSFSIGERVAFDTPDRGTVTGILTKYNRKSVTVVAEGGGIWNVGPSLLRKIIEPEQGQDAVTAGGKVIALPSKRGSGA